MSFPEGFPTEEEHDYLLDAYLFCHMLEDNRVIPITYNENTACLMYQRTGAVFSPNQWRQIATQERKHTEEKGDGSPN